MKDLKLTPVPRDQVQKIPLSSEAAGELFSLLSPTIYTNDHRGAFPSETILSETVYKFSKSDFEFVLNFLSQIPEKEMKEPKRKHKNSSKLYTEWKVLPNNDTQAANEVDTIEIIFSWSLLENIYDCTMTALDLDNDWYLGGGDRIDCMLPEIVMNGDSRILYFSQFSSNSEASCSLNHYNSSTYYSIRRSKNLLTRSTYYCSLMF
ncbi:hypothetical protein AB3N59_03425 [Leptospira sp. WS92.C1]